jgi:hypothetical protein
VNFRFVVNVETKNDGLTRDAGREAIAVILTEIIAEAVNRELPWVISWKVEEGDEGAASSQ